MKGSIGRRATIAAWSLFMSIFPFILFVFQLIRYLPFYEDIQFLLYNYFLRGILPNNLFDMANDYVHESTELVHKKFLDSDMFFFIFTFLMFIILSSNGIRSLIRGFRSIHYDFHKTTEVKEWLTAFFLTIFFAIFISVSLIVFYTTEIIVKLFEDSVPSIIIDHKKAINVLNIILLFLVSFLGLSFLYYLSKTKYFKFKEVIWGALLTSILCFLTTYFFGYYITHFTRINALYGSISSIILLMIWVKINVIFILIGYELNVALVKAKHT